MIINLTNKEFLFFYNFGLIDGIVYKHCNLYYDNYFKLWRIFLLPNKLSMLPQPFKEISPSLIEKDIQVEWKDIHENITDHNKILYKEFMELKQILNNDFKIRIKII